MDPRGPTGLPYILGMVTHAISQTEIESVMIYSTDAETMVTDFDQFIATHQRQCIISAHRMMVDLASDLLEELLDQSMLFRLISGAS